MYAAVVCLEAEPKFLEITAMNGQSLWRMNRKQKNQTKKSKKIIQITKKTKQ